MTMETDKTETPQESVVKGAGPALRGRRRVLRGVVSAVPVMLTLRSGAARATASTFCANDGAVPALVNGDAIEANDTSLTLLGNVPTKLTNLYDHDTNAAVFVGYDQDGSSGSVGPLPTGDPDIDEYRLVLVDTNGTVTVATSANDIGTSNGAASAGNPVTASCYVSLVQDGDGLFGL